MRSWKSIIALSLLVALLAPAAVQARSYETFTVDVPFEFTIGDRKFKPGTYTFVVLGPGLMAVEDSKKHVFTTLITRDIRGGDNASFPHVFFDQRKGHAHLASIWMGKGPQGLEVVGEQVAIRQSQPPAPLLLAPQQRMMNMPQPLK